MNGRVAASADLGSLSQHARDYPRRAGQPPQAVDEEQHRQRDAGAADDPGPHDPRPEGPTQTEPYSYRE